MVMATGALIATSPVRSADTPAQAPPDTAADRAGQPDSHGRPLPSCW
jgi:hypothetical protein